MFCFFLMAIYLDKKKKKKTTSGDSEISRSLAFSNFSASMQPKFTEYLTL